MEKKASTIDGIKAVKFLINSTIIVSIAILVVLYYAIVKEWIDMPIKYILIPSYSLVIIMLGFFSLTCDAAIYKEYRRLEALEQKDKEDKNDDKQK